MVDESEVSQGVDSSAGAPDAPPQESSSPQSAEGGERTIQEKILDLKEKPQAEAPKEEAPKAPEAAGAVIPVVPEVPKYEPNFKYKAFGKEKELDPFFQGLIKDADSEKKVKDVFTKADAFEEIKGQKDQLNNEYQQVNQKFSALDKDVRRITGFLNNGDYDNFFRSLNISDERLLQHLQQKAEIQKLSPVQQQQYQDAVNLRANDYNREQEFNQMREMMNQQAVQYRTMQLDSVLSSPNMASAAQAWDAKMGEGAFRQLVIEEGANLHRSTNRDASPAEVAQMVVQKWKAFLEQPQAPQVQGGMPPSALPQSAPQPQAPVAPQAKPVIPNVQGRGASPIQQAPKSLDDLRKLGKQLEAEHLNRGME